jgi:preprotein translocase subunit YajC
MLSHDSSGSPRCHTRALLLTARHSGPMVQVDGSLVLHWLPLAPAAKKAEFLTMRSSILDILQAAAPAAGEPPAWVTFMPFVGMAVIFWFFILRPQMRQQKQQREKINAIKRGDQVLTAGGIVGKVVKLIDDDYAEVELAPNLKVKVLKSTITDVVLPTGSAPAND